VKTKNSLKSLLRAVSVLESFSPRELELGVADIARKNRMPKTTAHRILSTLTEGKLLERNSKTGKYRIGPALYAFGSLYLSTTDVLKAAEPVMKTLNDITSEAINLGILNMDNMILIQKEESKHAYRIARHIGSVLSAYATAMGKALLSELSITEIDSLFPEERLQPITKKTIASKTELKLELEQIRKTGVAFDIEGNYEGGVGIASIIRDASGRAAAAMSITIPVSRMNPSGCEHLGTLVRLGSNLVSYRLGYQDTANPVRDVQEILSWWEDNRLDVASQTK